MLLDIPWENNCTHIVECILVLYVSMMSSLDAEVQEEGVYARSHHPSTELSKDSPEIC